MPWLNYTDDEVARFHPAFQAIATEALHEAHLQNDFEWIHHARNPSNPLIPDFVLRRRVTGQWVLSVELKRTKEAVLSTRNQVQAKAYAETNQHLYGPG